MKEEWKWVGIVTACVLIGVIVILSVLAGMLWLRQTFEPEQHICVCMEEE